MFDVYFIYAKVGKKNFTVDASLLGHIDPCIFWPHKAADGCTKVCFHTESK